MSAASPPSLPDRRSGNSDRRVSEQRRRRLAARALPLALLAVAAFAVGTLVGSQHESQERKVAQRFVRAWERGDYGGMYALLGDRSRAQLSSRALAGLYRDAAQTATIERVRRAGPLRNDDDGFTVPMRAETRRFGVLKGTLRLEVGSDDDGTAGVIFRRRLVFPGLRDGEALRSTVVMPERSDLEARDGTVLATGPERTSDIGTLAANVVGSVGPIPAADRARYAALGYPDDAAVGLTGLERQFESRLAGTFGGTLRAGDRVLRQAVSKPGKPVRTSIDVDIEEAAVTALAGRFGGIAVLRPRTGEVLALAGIGYSAPQPPGSTFKIITLAAALDARIAKPSSSYPIATEATLAGVALQNASGEACGGTLEQAFAESCNSVFAPLGARLGAKRLVAAAERFGFNETSDIPGAPPSSIPPAAEIGDDLAIGSSAIGQGRVTSTPLRMAEVAGAIANRGVHVRPVFLRGARGRRSRATSRRTARTITKFMRAVVDGGTGAAAAIPGVRVAGKTGTAELRTTQPPDPDDPNAEPVDPNDTSDTDAWFVAFAPAQHAKVVVAVLLVGQGAGGATAAPAARTVLEAAL
ncbi:MAG: penicillin-binding protein [Solirubrobacteraceae bacterium]|nr:penicillin-binding protein [Solirubrobacteraceae bacterium]